MRVLLSLALVLTLAAIVRATTVRPPTFYELVADAELVFRGRVTTVRAQWTGEAGRRHISTVVTFAVERILKGAAPETLTLQFLGGELDGEKLHVAGWPEFKEGERGLFFVENRAGRLCPLVRLRHGRYRIVADTENRQEHIIRDDYTPLESVAAVVTPLAEANIARSAALTNTTLTLTEFETQIINQARRQAATQPGVSSR